MSAFGFKTIAIATIFLFHSATGELVAHDMDLQRQLRGGGRKRFGGGSPCDGDDCPERTEGLGRPEPTCESLQPRYQNAVELLDVLALEFNAGENDVVDKIVEQTTRMAERAQAKIQDLGCAGGGRKLRRGGFGIGGPHCEGEDCPERPERLEPTCENLQPRYQDAMELLDVLALEFNAGDNEAVDRMVERTSRMAERAQAKIQELGCAGGDRKLRLGRLFGGGGPKCEGKDCPERPEGGMGRPERVEPTCENLQPRLKDAEELLGVLDEEFLEGENEMVDRAIEMMTRMAERAQAKIDDLGCTN